MIKSVNPYTQQEVFEIEELSSGQVEKVIEKADTAFLSWREVSFKERSRLMLDAAKELRKNKQEYAETITKEMGKPITLSLDEIEKCAWLCEYYAENAEKQLADRKVVTEAFDSYVTHEPLGVVLAVMPWNYPLWQVFRFAVPLLMAGNVGILKHASNVIECAENIQKIFWRAGFPEGCFTNLAIRSGEVEKILRNKKVKAVALTGSNGAGSAVAAIAGSEIKRSVMELGGSNALVVLEDADIDKTVKTCVLSRFQNTGQSCIAGKRLLVHSAVAEEFTQKFVAAVKALKSGDPMDKDTYIGTMAREDLAQELEASVQNSVKQGAKILTGGKRNAAYLEPTVLGNVTPEMSVFTDETFGPVIGITLFDTEEQAVALANDSIYGLGASIFTEDLQRARRLIPKFDDGSVFINERVKSDPRLPFGGVKSSGYGRELSYEGIQEFVNVKTVYINKYE
ncbi:NAD-dependent succinate-semialdehyde dehydrogenase [Flavobacterium sp. LC2016-01]|uniref:NAD-dependent succinate-semialdehyde dehydrogenase n=1 Tax=Flavobacterium sp. LC2016-01 TaxID=2675876 RepID=UPI0012BA6EBE|nr:NAD-dependent succinate-semialdehyde dehydrogenase [Flavobacterium sp. LC2016-01]MTH17733.1 aldehyde dehydrogenase family protein [Flavobacterium sp. LC2016-01]